MTKAYGYIRCSGLGQMDGEGPDRQREAITSFASDDGIEIVGWYVESHTGKDLEGRPEFREMRSAMVSNGVKCVVVEKLDRLARSILIQETIIGDFRKNAIQLLSATPGEIDLCGDDPTRTMIRQILGCFFEYERKMIVEKLRDARARIKSKTGRCEGRHPFGMKPGESEILDEIRSLREESLTFDSIAAILNVRNRPSRSGKPWIGASVSKIVRRERKKAAD